MEYQIFLAGVGGQGILSVTDILCNAAIEMGFNVRGSETHGMSQRGGSVFSNVRFGDVHSPLIMERTADILISFEPAEALRYVHFVKPEGYCLINKHPIPSPSFILSKESYPEIGAIISVKPRITRVARTAAWSASNCPCKLLTWFWAVSRAA